MASVERCGTSPGNASPLFSVGNSPHGDSSGGLAAQSINSLFTNGLIIRRALTDSALRMEIGFLAVPHRWLYRAIPERHVAVANRQAPHSRPDGPIRYQRAQKGVN